MTKDNTEHKWARFEKQLQEVPPEDWECFAPRSPVQGRREREIYKLFVRVRGSNKSRAQWWRFETGLDRMPADFPEKYYEKTDDTRLVRGPLELLRDIQAESSKPALSKALQLIHAHLADPSAS